MRSSSIWVPLFIAGAAAVTVAVVVQRQSRLSAKTEGRLSGPASESMTDESADEPARVEAWNDYPTRDFDLDPDPETASVDVTPPSTPERGEAYDAVSADNLGAEWLARATESHSANHTAALRGELEELTTLDLIDEEAASLPDLEFDPEPNTDSKGPIESEAVLADREARKPAARQESPRPPPAVFDIAELLQDDAPAESKRRS